MKQFFSVLLFSLLLGAPLFARADVPEEAFLPGEAEAIYGDNAFVAEQPQVMSEDVTAKVMKVVVINCPPWYLTMLRLRSMGAKHSQR